MRKERFMSDNKNMRESFDEAAIADEGKATEQKPEAASIDETQNARIDNEAPCEPTDKTEEETNEESESAERGDSESAAEADEGADEESDTEGEEASPAIESDASEGDATESDTEKLLDFLNTEGRKKDMFPVVKSLDDFRNLYISDFYLLLDGESIVATAAMWNQTEYKQYVVKRYGGLMRIARIFNPILSAMRYIKLPKENEPLNFPMLAFFLCKDDNTNTYRIFLDEIKREIAKNYSMFVIGLTDSHFAKPIMDKLPSISFKTEIYEIKFPWSEETYTVPDPKSMYLECGLL